MLLRWAFGFSSAFLFAFPALAHNARIESFTQQEQVERVPIIPRVPLDFPALVRLFPSGSILREWQAPFLRALIFQPF